MGVHPEMSLFELELRHQEALEYKAQQNKLEMEEDAAKNWWQTLFLEELTACFHEYYKLKTLTYAGQRERVHKFFGEHLSHEQCVALCARKDFIKRLGGVRNAAATKLAKVLGEGASHGTLFSALKASKRRPIEAKAQQIETTKSFVIARKSPPIIPNMPTLERSEEHTS